MRSAPSAAMKKYHSPKCQPCLSPMNYYALPIKIQKLMTTSVRKVHWTLQITFLQKSIPQFVYERESINRSLRWTNTFFYSLFIPI